MIKPTLFWDEAKTDAIVWLNLRTKFIDNSVLLGGIFALDEFGISYDLMPVPAFIVFAGHAPQIRPPMGAAAGAGAHLVNWKNDKDMEILQKRARADQRELILSVIPERLLTPMRENRSIRGRTTEYIFSRLDALLGTLTSEDFAYLMKQIEAPYTPLTTPDVFLANWQEALGDLAQAGQPISQMMATGYLQKCFGSEFNKCWITFVRLFPLVAHRTVERLCTTIIAFAKNELPILTAQAQIGISLVTSQTALLVQMQDQIAELQQALATSQARTAPARPDTRKRGGMHGAGPGGPPVRAARQRREDVPIAQRLFCWTHGPCHSHKGDACMYPAQGHKELATWTNQMGSKWRVDYAQKGRSIA
jgi:hypothetical protein